MSVIPSRLYKYRPFNTNTLQLFTRSNAYYANPRSFNDPFDCAPTIDVDIDVTSLEQLCCQMIKQTSSEAAAKCKINEFRYLSEDREKFETDTQAETALTGLLSRQIQDMVNAEMGGKGVLSLSARWQSLLMWSHYADEHRGICIEYDTTCFNHSGIEAVNYRAFRGIKASILARWKLDGCSVAYKTVHAAYFLTKSREWRYEAEWRDIHASSGVTESGLKVSAIYFGHRCHDAVAAVIVSLLPDRPDVSFFKVNVGERDFRLRGTLVDRNDMLAWVGRPSTRSLRSDAHIPDPRAGSVDC